MDKKLEKAYRDLRDKIAALKLPTIKTAKPATPVKRNDGGSIAASFIAVKPPPERKPFDLRSWLK